MNNYPVYENHGAVCLACRVRLIGQETHEQDEYIIHNCHAVPLDSPCWIWRGLRNSDGYAKEERYNGTLASVGRDILGLGRKKLVQMHACDNPPCVNPDHLKAGTQLENMRDMARKNRGRKPILTDEDVQDVHRMLAKGASDQKVARLYGVSDTTVYNIRTGRKRRSVPIPPDAVRPVPERAKPWYWGFDD